MLILRFDPGALIPLALGAVLAIALVLLLGIPPLLAASAAAGLHIAAWRLTEAAARKSGGNRR